MNEARKLNGISHFIEHLVFKGTENRTAREIALAMDSVGGQMDAFKSRLSLAWVSKALNQFAKTLVALSLPRFDLELNYELVPVLREILYFVTKTRLCFEVLGVNFNFWPSWGEGYSFHSPLLATALIFLNFKFS